MTKFQEAFFKAMNYTKEKNADRFSYKSEDSSMEDYYYVYEKPDCHIFTVAGYRLSNDFSLPFKSTKEYLRFGNVYSGTANYDIEGKSITDFTPSPFIVREVSAKGKQHWHEGQYYKGNEILIEMAYLKALTLQYPELERLHSLKPNFIYYNLPQEVLDCLLALEIKALNHKLTNLFLSGSIFQCLSHISYELTKPEEGCCYASEYQLSAIDVGCKATIRLTEADLAAVKRAHKLIKSNTDAPPTIPSLCSDLLISQQKLCQGFKRLYNTTVGNFIIEQRMHQAAQLLLSTDLSIHQIALKVGYTNSSNFSKAFARKYIKTPLKYRNSKH